MIDQTIEFEFDENAWDIKGLLSYGKLAFF